LAGEGYDLLAAPQPFSQKFSAAGVLFHKSQVQNNPRRIQVGFDFETEALQRRFFLIALSRCR
jgi:hypothetical protein